MRRFTVDFVRPRVADVVAARAAAAAAANHGKIKRWTGNRRSYSRVGLRSMTAQKLYQRYIIKPRSAL